MKIKVLVTSLGSNNSIGIIKALRSYKNIIVVGTDSNDLWRCNGADFADIFFKVPYYNSPGYIEAIIDIVRKEDIQCLIPVHDLEIEVISKNKASLEKYCKVACNNYETIAVCNNKRAVNELLRDIVNVPLLFASPADFIYPVICKPVFGVSSKNIMVYKNQTDFIDNNFSDFFFQQYITGVEYTVDCYTSYSNKSFVYSVRERVETKEGMSVKSCIIDDPGLGAACQIIHQKLEYTGVSNIQFIKTADGTNYFIEINPRFAGAGILTYTHGLNMPLATVLELLGIAESQLDQNQLKYGVNMVRYLSETYLDEAGNII